MLDRHIFIVYNGKVETWSCVLGNSGTGAEEMKDDLNFLRLWDLYSPLLTATRQEIAELYFNYDLSLGEIAEQKGVSRQSVSDCLQKCRKQLEKYEEKLGFAKTLQEMQEKLDALQKQLDEKR